jgi:hypothetical protein
MAAFATPIPAEILPPLRAWEVPAPAASESSFDPAIWDGGIDDASTPPVLMSGEAIIEEYATWVEEAFARPLSVAPSPAAERPAEALRATQVDVGVDVGVGVNVGVDAGAGVGAGLPAEAIAATPAEIESTGMSTDRSAEAQPSPESIPGLPGLPALPFAAEWASVRDANIRPYGEWRAAEALSLPVMPRAPGGAGARGAAPEQTNGHTAGNGAGHSGGNGGGAGHQARGRGQGAGPAQTQGSDSGRGGRRRGRRPGGGGNGGGFGRDRDRGDRGERNGRFRDRGPRLPGFYNPGGD